MALEGDGGWRSGASLVTRLRFPAEHPCRQQPARRPVRNGWASPTELRAFDARPGALYCGFTGITRYPLDGSPEEFIGGAGMPDISADGRLFGLDHDQLYEIDLTTKAQELVWPNGEPKMRRFGF